MLHSNLCIVVNGCSLHPWHCNQCAAVLSQLREGQFRFQGLLNIQNGGIFHPVAILKAGVAMGTRLLEDVTTAITKSLILFRLTLGHF